MRHGELQEFRYRDGPEARLELPVGRRDVGEEDVAVRIWMERSDADLELPVRFEEAARLDLHRMRTQSADPARIVVDRGRIIRRMRDTRPQPISAEIAIATSDSGSRIERPSWVVLKMPWKGATSGQVTSYINRTNGAGLAPNSFRTNRIAIRTSMNPTIHQTA